MEKPSVLKAATNNVVISVQANTSSAANLDGNIDISQQAVDDANCCQRFV